MSLIKWEYVMSGMTYCHHYYEGANQYVADVFNRDLGADFGLLYNAHTEAQVGELYALPRGIRMYADSGGLQMVTLNKDITPEAKDAVYREQAKWSTHAMSFDEIPVGKYTSGNSSMGDRSGRFYDPAVLRDRALATADNINRQFEVFDEHRAATEGQPRRAPWARPIAIVHGNDARSMLQWCEYMFDRIKPENVARMRTVAVSSIAIGSGALQEFERAFVFSEINRRWGFKHLHLLGVGSAVRVLPFAALPLAGVVPDVHISFDSTTHSSRIYFGAYIAPDRTLKVPKTMCDEWRVIHDNIVGIFGKEFISWETAEDMPKLLFGGFAGLEGADKDRVTKAKLAVPCAMAYNMTKQVVECTKDVNTLLAAMPKELYVPTREFMKVGSLTEYDAWRREFASKMDNKPLQHAAASLEDMFA